MTSKYVHVAYNMNSDLQALNKKEIQIAMEMG